MHCADVGQCGNSVYMPAKRPKRELKRPPLRRMSGEELRNWRLRYGMSQAELGDILGVTAKAISNWELGLRKIPPYLYYALAFLEQNNYVSNNNGLEPSSK